MRNEAQQGGVLSLSSPLYGKAPLIGLERSGSSVLLQFFENANSAKPNFVRDLRHNLMTRHHGAGFQGRPLGHQRQLVHGEFVGIPYLPLWGGEPLPFSFKCLSGPAPSFFVRVFKEKAELP